MSILTDPSEFKSDVDMMFSARGIVPWHGMGNIVDKIRSGAEAQKLSGIEDATLEPVFIKREAPLGTMPDAYVPVQGRLAVMVPSQPQPLQIVSNRYELLQPRAAFEFADGLIENSDAEYETAGSLKGQRLYWVMLRMNQEIPVGRDGDAIKPYLFLRDSRDGSSAFMWSLVNERVVCRNTWRKATAEGNITSLRHRSGIVARLHEAKDILLKAHAAMEEEVDLIDALARQEVNAKDVRQFYLDLLPLPVLPDLSKLGKSDREKREEAFEISKMHVLRDRGTMLNLFENGKGSDLAGTTAWGLFNSVTDFVDHYRAPDAQPETVMYSSMLGVGNDLKVNGMALAQQMLGVRGEAATLAAMSS